MSSTNTLQASHDISSEKLKQKGHNPKMQVNLTQFSVGC